MRHVSPEGVRSMADGVRRRPAQRRSAERVERLLDACAELLAESGQHALTTREVARRAGVPIGTLYQFFEGKSGLLHELAMRQLAVLMARLRERLTAAPARSWADAAVLVYEESLALRRTVPGFFVADFRDPGPIDAGLLRRIDTEMAGRLHELGTAEIGLPPLPDAERVLLVAITSADGLLRLAFQTDADGDPATIALGARLLRAYFADITGEPGGGSDGEPGGSGADPDE
ncbi:TetR/AcrR family transcriptional regulator [Actinomadura sp. LCR2-06]|uniref:TetR/AcrR family transcriptional regulator n=2 Tax=Actinomadura violacea TaxID=2819934 RepID=A0ABS3RPL4_9ACTN|nr:TetR/AcrR family transcriptional regulator [Actinomadura violacea]